jgi:sorting nexin-29
VNCIDCVERINDNISVLKLSLKQKTKGNKKVLLNLINVHAPHSGITEDDPQKTEEFYSILSETYRKYHRRRDFTFIGGDFNARVGNKISEGEVFLGSFAHRTERNPNGLQLAEFASYNHLYLANTRFKHPAKHNTTWFSAKDCSHRQIDYFVLPQNKTKLLIDSRSYNGTKKTSDHSMLLTTINFARRFYSSKVRRVKKTLLDVHSLANDEELQHRYKTKLAERFSNKMRNCETPNEDYLQCIQIMKEVAEEVIPKRPRRIDSRVDYRDLQLDTLIAEKKRLEARLRSKKQRGSITREELKLRRNGVLAKINERVKILKNEKLVQLANELEKNKNNSKCFDIANTLINGKRSSLKLVDEKDVERVNTDTMIQMIDGFYITFYNQEGFAPTAPWDGEPRQLEEMITPLEVEHACKRLNNGRAAGKDGLIGELFKYGGFELHESLANAFNKIFSSHKNIDAILEGVLIAVNKPGKKPLPSNTRPITLLNMTRKILSNVLLERIYANLDGYISPGQSGFRRGRSTSDVVWSYRWLMAISQRYNIDIKITGIDMSKAFDCINRTELLDTAKGLITTSNFRILKYLLSETNLSTRINDVYGTPFRTTIGTPQGDALSPVLFTVYLESALRKFIERFKIPRSSLQQIICYADDTDFINIERIADDLPQILRDYNLKMNVEKTEYIKLSATENKTMKSKKLGSKLNSEEDLNYRISLATVAFANMQKIWTQDEAIEESTKLKLYNACIIPIIMYNLSSITLTSASLQRLNAFHRKQLRILLRVFYPEVIKNEELYRRTNQIPLSLQIVKQRWSLFGHILRQNVSTAAWMIMTEFFNTGDAKGNGDLRSCRITLPTILNCDLKSIPEIDRDGLREVIELKRLKFQLKDNADLNNLRDLAAHRSQWKELAKAIFTAQYNDYFHIKSDREGKRETRANQKYANDNFVTGQEYEQIFINELG